MIAIDGDVYFYTEQATTTKKTNLIYPYTSYSK